MALTSSMQFTPESEWNTCLVASLMWGWPPTWWRLLSSPTASEEALRLISLLPRWTPETGIFLERMNRATKNTNHKSQTTVCRYITITGWMKSRTRESRLCHLWDSRWSFPKCFCWNMYLSICVKLTCKMNYCTEIVGVEFPTSGGQMSCDGD